MPDDPPVLGQCIDLWWCPYHGLTDYSTRLPHDERKRCCADIGYYEDFESCGELVYGPFVVRVIEVNNAPPPPPPPPTPEKQAADREQLRQEVRRPLPYEAPDA